MQNNNIVPLSLNKYYVNVLWVDIKYLKSAALNQVLSYKCLFVGFCVPLQLKVGGPNQKPVDANY